MCASNPGPANPRSIGRDGACSCTITSQRVHACLGRTIRMTLKCAGTYSSISATSSPNPLSVPPQSGQIVSFGSCVWVSRGKCAGRGFRFDDRRSLCGSAASDWVSRSACAVSKSSSRNSNCSICWPSFSELRPNCIRLSFAISSFRFSISLLWESSSACFSISRVCFSSSSVCFSSTNNRSAFASRLVRSGNTAVVTRQTLTHSQDSSGLEFAHIRRVFDFSYTSTIGALVRIGRRQSMPSSNIDNCARVSETVPLSAFGQMKRPRSSRLANKHNPSPSNQSSFIKSPRRPRKTNTCPENGLFSNTVCAIALSPVNPLRRSVTPAAIQISVLAGNPIIESDLPLPHARIPDPRFLQSALVRAPNRSRCIPPLRPWIPVAVLLSHPPYPTLSPVTAQPPSSSPFRQTILPDIVFANGTPDSHSRHAPAPPVIPKRPASTLPRRSDAAPISIEIVFPPVSP